jgi:putative inorganic carbon (hco3(-)) transporter
MCAARNGPLLSWRESGDEFSGSLIGICLQPIRLLLASPSLLFLLTLAAMLLRPPDVSFYEIDRVAFGLLLLSAVASVVVRRESFFRIERVTWPMLALTIMAVASVITQPFDAQPWSLIAAKFLVPFALFHVAARTFTNERSLRQFESFALLALAYLCFLAISFLCGATWLIFPRFIVDPNVGIHADRARGPLLQAVANGVSLNLLGVLALHACGRGRFRRAKSAILLAAVPVAIVATMTRAVWLTFAGTLFLLGSRSPTRALRRACLGVVVVSVTGLGIVLAFSGLRTAVADRWQERGPIEFRQAVYSGGWQMFLARPLTGWGANQTPSELARYVSGYDEKEVYPHNTYLELLVEHGIVGFAAYLWLIWELWRLSRGVIPIDERDSFLNRSFRSLWPILLAVYFVNACFVVMNYQFVSGLLFTLAGMLAAQNRRSRAELKR